MSTTAITARQIDATDAALLEAHDVQCKSLRCGRRSEQFGGKRRVFRCDQLINAGKTIVRMYEQYRAQTPEVGDTVNYHGSLTEAHGRYVVLAHGHDQWGRPAGYDLSDGTQRLRQVRRESITRVMRTEPQAPEPRGPQGQISLF